MNGRPSIRLHFAGTPPSMNQIPDAGLPLREAAQSWRDRIAQALRDGYELPEHGRLTVELTLFYADRRSRNPENYAPVLRRALVDAVADVGCDCVLEGFTVKLAKRACEATSIRLIGELGGSR